MERRKFMHCSVAAAITIPGVLSLSGCGGGGGGGESSASVSEADTQVSAINALQATNDSLHADVSSSTSSLLTPVPSSTMQASTTITTQSSELFSRFQEGTLSLQAGTLDSYFDRSTVWENYLAARELSYQQANAQLTKLKASLRLYGNKQKTAQSGAILASAVSGTNSTLDELLATLNTAIDHFKNGQFGYVAIDGLTFSIKAVFAVLGTLVETTNGYAYLSLAFSTVQGILEYIQTKSVESLSFATNTDVLMSLVKFSIAVVSAIGIASIEKLQSAGTLASTVTLSTEEQQQLNAFLEGIALQSQLILTFTGFVNTIMTNMATATQERTEALMQVMASSEAGYTLSDEDAALIDSLRQQSLVLAAMGLAMKVLLSFYQSSLNSVVADETLQNDAQTYAVLFTDPINAYDTIFSGFTAENFAALFGNNTVIQELLTTLQTINPLFSVSATGDALNATADAESDAFTFASLLAQLSYQFTSDTATQAYNFATHMADLAYQFTMKIEDDAYTFAMQGMEYGYLFASRGEEVGLMADRILWMAVQIGVMADRIGEMADRIVYTEQLIVYTEMLILDFGLLIYGGMKQITNLMLTGMAIVFDREWYTPQSSDPIVSLISEMTKQMLSNMQEYETAVLQNQLSLRELTLKALDWIQGEY